MSVYKTATCGCCAAWVEHLRESGFEAAVENVSRAVLGARKRDPGMPLGSPGMEYGERRDPYNVIAFDAAGGLRIFARNGQ